MSGRPEGELSRRQCRVAGRAVRSLDLVRFEYQAELEDPAQPENVLVAVGEWELVEELDPRHAYAELSPYLEAGPGLLGGVQRGVPDTVAQEGMEASLCLVEPDSINFVSAPPYGSTGSNRPRAVFQLDGHGWDLSITDAVVGPKLRRSRCGSHSLEDLGFSEPEHVLLTVSTTTPLDGTRWKLAAAVHLLP